MYLHALQAECCFGFLFVFSTGLEPGASYMLGKHSTTKTSIVLEIFQIYYL